MTTIKIETEKDFEKVIEAKFGIKCTIDNVKDLYDAAEKIYATKYAEADLPKDIDVMTYSFPCQNLSIAGVMHGVMTGIDRNIKNRSGMLWEVERILKERDGDNEEGYTLPKIIFWNVAGTTNGLPVTKNDNDVIMVSGFSTNLLECIFDVENFIPVEQMLKALDKYISLIK